MGDTKTKFKESMDFYKIETKAGKGNRVEVYPEYRVRKVSDLIIRGERFYAVFNQETGLWSEDKVVVQEVVDGDIDAKIEELNEKQGNVSEDLRIKYIPKYLSNFSSNNWMKFEQYAKSLPDTRGVILDRHVTYDNETPQKSDYVSKKLPYSLSDGSCDAWDEMLSVLYDPEEREKIEWAIGAILTGDAQKIQKFLVFYGPQGSGKSTILDIVMKLLKGYYATFKAENIVSSNDQFGCKFLSSNPLVAIDADTNLSRIETNATINKIASHEELEVNEKYKAQYVVKPICMMMLGTNKPVRITDAKSGIIRRLIDIEPSGRLIKPFKKYDALNRQIEMQLGAIAKHCIDVYSDPSRGPHYYDDYIPERMMYRTDPFFNFMQEHFEEYKNAPYVQATLLWAQWKDYCTDSGVEYTKKRYEIIDEAKNYFNEFYKETTTIDGVQVRSRFVGFKVEKFLSPEEKKQTKKKTLEEHKDVIPEEESASWLHLDQTTSILDDLLKDCPAQYEIYDEDRKQSRPEFSWKNVKTKLKDIDTSKTHYVAGFPENLITIDFDKRDANGNKSLGINILAVAKHDFPPTYAECSNSGEGLHLEYWYDGDVSKLSSLYDEDIEVKVYPKDQNRALRRRVTRTNNHPIAHISCGLPFKEIKPMINYEGVQDDKHLRNMIKQAIDKNVHPYGESPKTITCMKYIRDILKQAQDKGMKYDIRDLEEVLYAFAANSHNNAEECINIFYSLDLTWPKERKEASGSILTNEHDPNKPIIILDCEVIQNLTLVIYKELESDGVPAINKKEKDVKYKCVRLYNPKPHEIEKLFQMRIVGHNVTGYDNYILYALWLGYTPEQVFQLSQSIINGARAPWYEAKNISYTDTYDVSSDKKGLKKIEIEMHIPHKEMEIDWSKPLPESEWERLAKYCENDVLATEAYFLSKGWQADFKARKILAALTGMTVNDSTNNLTAQLIFGDVREPWHEFNKPDLTKLFPEYHIENGKSYYGDVEVGEGGRVYAVWGDYYNVVTFDVSSMHPSSIIIEEGFGPYTKNYADLKQARIAIKHKDYDAARKMFDGRLAPYLENDEDADALSHALKIALNSVYGMTAARFQNRFKDPRNLDNWVAKRGALFMEKLRREVTERGGKVVHIKTDSIKLENPTKELSDFVIDFGSKYGYTFEIESHYERMCLVNNAVYIALRAKDDPGWLKECAKAKKRAEQTETPYIEPTRWTATGAQFAHPYVFKYLFSHEPLDFWDFCETKTVKTALYLDLNENLPDVTQFEKEKDKIQTKIRKLKKVISNKADPQYAQAMAELEALPRDIDVLDEEIAKGHSYYFVGKAGEFMPVIPGCGGGLLMRKESDGGYGFATGAKGYRWIESESMVKLNDWKKYIDIRYFRGLVDDARETISKYCDFDLFVRGEEDILNPGERIVEYDTDPWMLPCKSEKYAYCSDCPDFTNDDNGGCSCKQGYDISKQILGESKEIIL